MREMPPGEIVVPDVVLRIERALRRFREDDAREERVDAARERQESALAGMPLEDRLAHVGEARGVRVADGARFRAFDIPRNACATGEQQRRDRERSPHMDHVHDRPCDLRMTHGAPGRAAR